MTLLQLIPKDCEKLSITRILHAIRDLTWFQWGHFFVGWLAYCCDVLGFVSLTLSVPNLAQTFGRPVHEIAVAVTISQVLRPLGAGVVGALSDRFGRRYPLFFVLIFVGSFEIAGPFVTSFNQFMALRCVYGLGYGAVWSLAQSTALENLPVELRGIAGGVVAQASDIAYIIGAIVDMTLVQRSSAGWKVLFWFAGGAAFLAAGVRLLTPESAVFLAAQERERKALLESREKKTGFQKTRIFMKELSKMLHVHWPLLVYACLLITSFGLMSHGSQDLYPTYLQETKQLSPVDANIAIIVGYCGALTGGILSGLVSQFIGRRLTIMICVTVGAAFVPLWILPSSLPPLCVGAFFVQAGVQGIFGVVPIYLSEIAPPAFRASFTGVVYNVGNTIASASAPIEAAIGDQLKIKASGKVLPDYATVQGIFVGVSAVLALVLTALSRENHSSMFEQHRIAYEETSASTTRHASIDTKDTEKHLVTPPGSVAQRTASKSTPSVDDLSTVQGSGRTSLAAGRLDNN